MDQDTFDRDLADLRPAQRWRMWMDRIEAVVFASTTPVSTADLARIVGQGASIELLIKDIQAELAGRPYVLTKGAEGWMFRTRAQFADAIRAAADVGTHLLDLNTAEITVLAAIAFHQPLSRDGLKDIFGKDISRDLIVRLRTQGLITTGPRAPRRGAPHTYVTTQKFLTVFDLQDLHDLPHPDGLRDAGLLD